MSTKAEIEVSGKAVETLPTKDTKEAKKEEGSKIVDQTEESTTKNGDSEVKNGKIEAKSEEKKDEVEAKITESKEKTEAKVAESKEKIGKSNF